MWLWIGGVAIVVVIALGLWWISSNQSVNSDMGTQATSTAATSTGSNGGSTTSGGDSGPSITTRSGQTVKAIVASLSDASDFQSYFASTGVSAMVGSASQYTIFVPTNGAFNDLPAGTISKMTAAQLKRLVEYHVVSGKSIQANEEKAGAIQALSGDPLNFSNSNNIPMVNSSLLVAEYKGSNGVVYLINSVLLPPQKSTI